MAVSKDNKIQTFVISKKLDEVLNRYCSLAAISKSNFVATAVMEKVLRDIVEPLEDNDLMVKEFA